MISKFIKGAIITTLAMGLFTFQVNTAEASSKIMWGKTELKLGQIGKVTIKENTNLIKLNGDGSAEKVRGISKGEEFRVYQFNNTNNGYYGLGGGLFVPKSDLVKYDTPSKSKMEMLKNMSGIFTPVNLAEVSGIFKEVLPKYEQDNLDDAVEVYEPGTTGDRNNIKLAYTELNKAHYIYIGDMSKFEEGYEVAKRVGLYLSVSELKELMDDSKKRGDQVNGKGVYVYYTGKLVQIIW